MNCNNNNLTIEERVKIYTSRNAYGHLRYPRCVRAHFHEIMDINPLALTRAEVGFYRGLYKHEDAETERNMDNVFKEY